MPYSNIRKVKDVMLADWVVEGEFHEDTQYYDTIYYVIAEDELGERWVHRCKFLNEDVEYATRLLDRVKARGVIDLLHWEFDEFFSLTLEQRLTEEAFHEDMHRRGHGEYSKGVFSSGHE